jgi:hypothetical protein
VVPEPLEAPYEELSVELSDVNGVGLLCAGYAAAPVVNISIKMEIFRCRKHANCVRGVIFEAP